MPLLHPTLLFGALFFSLISLHAYIIGVAKMDFIAYMKLLQVLFISWACGEGMSYLLPLGSSQYRNYWEVINHYVMNPTTLR